MRSVVLTVAGALSSVSATPECLGSTLPGYDYVKTGAEGLPKDFWMWSYPYQQEDAPIVTPQVCFGRTKADAETPTACAAECRTMNTVNGVVNAKTMCQNDPNILATNNAVLSYAQTEGLFTMNAPNDASRNWFVWSSITKTADTWSDPDCSYDVVGSHWGDGADGVLPGTAQVLYETESDSAAATAPDAAVWIMGVDISGLDGAKQYGAPPYLAGVTAAAPNPADVFCFCQWDPYDSDNPCRSSTYDCCDGNVQTMPRVDVEGTNCVGGANYKEPIVDKDVSKAFEDAVGAAVGMATGLLVAVIVIPIVVIILLIVGIVCCCKSCNNNKPSA